MEEIKNEAVNEVVLIRDKKSKTKGEGKSSADLLKKNLLILDLDTDVNIKFLIKVRDGLLEGFTLGQRIDASKKLLDKQLPNKESIDLLSTIVTGIVKLPARTVPKTLTQIDEVIEAVAEKEAEQIDTGDFKVLTDEEVARNEAKEKVDKIMNPKIGRPKTEKKRKPRKPRKKKTKIASLEDSLTSAFSKNIEDENVIQPGDEI